MREARLSPALRGGGFGVRTLRLFFRLAQAVMDAGLVRAGSRAGVRLVRRAAFDDKTINKIYC